MMSAWLHKRPLVWSVVVVYGSLLLFTYSRMIVFVPDTITFGILDAARHLAEGRGLVSSVIPVSFLPYYSDHTLPLAYMWYPLLPLVTGALFKTFGPEPRLVLVLPILSYFCSGLLVAEIGRRIFSGGVGLAAAIVLLSQPFMLETSLRENFTDPVLVALILACVLAIVVAGERSDASGRRWSLVTAGVMLALSQYARSAALALYIPVFVLTYAIVPIARWRAVGTVAAAAVAGQVPLFIYNLSAVGSLSFTPTYILFFLSPAFPGLSSFVVLLPTSTAEVFGQYPTVIVKKWLSQLWVHYKYFFTFMNPLLLTSAVLSPLMPATAKRRALLLFTAALLVILIPFNSLIYWDNRYMLPVVPFIALLGIGFMQTLFAMAPAAPPLRMAIAAALVALLMIEPVDFLYQVWKTRDGYPRVRTYVAEQAAFLRETLIPGDIVMAADPGLVGWEADVPAVTLAQTPAIAREVKERYFPFNVLYLEAVRPRANNFYYAPEWYDISIEQSKFGAFRPVATRVISGRTFVILREMANAGP
jgi:hypothetical protein